MAPRSGLRFHIRSSGLRYFSAVILEVNLQGITKVGPEIRVPKPDLRHINSGTFFICNIGMNGLLTRGNHCMQLYAGVHVTILFVPLRNCLDTDLRLDVH
jgi:hypothetical protein